MKLKNRNYQKAEPVVYVSIEPDYLPLPPGAESVVRTAIAKALDYEGFSHPAELSVTFCNGPYIRTLNAEYRDKDAETDVLSFPIFDSEEEDPLEEEVIPLGDIVLNVERAAQQAEELGHSTLREIAFLTIHSVLHLLGYDHERSAEEEEDMCRRQREIITPWEKEFE